MTRFIDVHRDRFGVERICQVLQIAPSSYYAARTRPPSARALRDAALRPTIQDAHAQAFGVYGVRKLWRHLARTGITLGRDRLARLMTELGLAGVRRGKRVRTTRPGAPTARPADLVARRFTAPAPTGCGWPT